MKIRKVKRTTALRSVNKELAELEEEYGMSSEEMVRRFRRQLIPDTEWTVHWLMLLNIRKRLEKK